MFKALEVPGNENLNQFSRLLWQRQLSHRIHAIEGNQVLAVAKMEDISEAINLYQQWKLGQIQPTEDDSVSIGAFFSTGEIVGNGVQAFLRAPLTLLLIICCCVLAVLAPLDSYSGLTRLLLFPDFSYGTSTINLPQVLERFEILQLLKMFTPILLHGGLMHLAFNMLWLWEFGRRIEIAQSSLALLILILILALISNSTQYLYGGGNNFGGMSGVVYGLFAYIWMWQLFEPQLELRLPTSLVFFMLLSLGIMTFIGFDNIADSAHIGGLLCGVVYGAIVATISRIRRAMKITP